MTDSQAFTSTPDATSGNAIAVVVVTNAAGQVVNQQVMTLGDPTDGTLHTTVGASGLAVQPGPVTIAGGPVTALQGTSPWVVSGPVTLATNAATIGAVVLVTGVAGAVIGAVAQSTSPWVIAGAVTLATGAAVIGALAANQSVTGAVTVSGPVSASQATSPWVISGAVTLVTNTATIGQVALVTGAAVIGALTANQSVTGAMTQGTTPWVDNITQLGGVSMIGVAKGTQVTNAYPTQDFKDSGRTYVCLFFTSAAAITTEALATMQINKAGTVTSGTTYAVSAGKTLRLQSVNIGGRLTTLTNAITTRLAVRSAATVTVASAALLFVGTGTMPGTLTAVTAFAPEVMTIPDGLEIAASQQVGISHLETNTTAVVDCSLVGYEY